jgi:hypothetical protein
MFANALTVKLPDIDTIPVTKLPVVAFPVTLRVPCASKLPAEAVPTTSELALCQVADDVFLTITLPTDDPDIDNLAKSNEPVRILLALREVKLVPSP